MTGAAAPPAEPGLPPLSDGELTELALAADADAPVDPDAVCLWELPGWEGGQLLPEWYMPAPRRGGSSSRRRRWVIGLIVASFLLIDAYGLCSTYGTVTFG